MSNVLSPDLPVAGILADAVKGSRSGAVVVTAPPGSGKTMLVPAAVLDDLPPTQKLLLIQPRRLAARAVARRIAQLRGVGLGEEVGYQVRFDSCASRETRLVVVTTGILLRRLLDDVALENTGAVVIDEFHERSIEMDLALGMLIRLHQTVRPDLRIAVMSATLSAEPVARLLGGCPMIHAEGRPFPVQVRYQRRGERRPIQDLVATLVPEALRETSGHVLVFLPGVGEIIRCREAVTPLAERQGHALLPLFGDLPVEQQDRVLADLGRRKIILATNVAETSLTIEGVTAVIDSGQARQLHVSAATGLPRLELVPISRASAEQRAGRAGARRQVYVGDCGTSRRTKHGRPQRRPKCCAAIWPGRSCNYLRLANGTNSPGSIRRRKTPSRTPTACSRCSGQSTTRRKSQNSGRSWRGCRPIRDLAACSWPVPVMAYCVRHRSPRHCSRSEIHFVRRSTVAAVRANMARCEAGRTLLIASWPCRRIILVRPQTTRLLSYIRAERKTYCARQSSYIILPIFRGHRGLKIPALRSCKLCWRHFPIGLPDCAGTQDRALLVGGRGVRIDGTSRVRSEPLFLAIDINDAGGEACARLNSAVERSWLPAGMLHSREELFFNPTRGQVEARMRTYWVDLLLEETPVAISDWTAAAELLRARGPAPPRPLVARGRYDGWKIPGARSLARQCNARFAFIPS